MNSYTGVIDFLIVCKLQQISRKTDTHAMRMRHFFLCFAIIVAIHHFAKHDAAMPRRYEAERCVPCERHSVSFVYHLCAARPVQVQHHSLCVRSRSSPCVCVCVSRVIARGYCSEPIRAPIVRLCRVCADGKRRMRVTMRRAATTDEPRVTTDRRRCYIIKI